jgi:hypothetical protein
VKSALLLPAKVPAQVGIPILMAFHLPICMQMDVPTGDGFGSRPKTWWTYFTNWTFIVFAIWSLMGICISAAHVQVMLHIKILPHLAHLSLLGLLHQVLENFHC